MPKQFKHGSDITSAQLTEWADILSTNRTVRTNPIVCAGTITSITRTTNQSGIVRGVAKRLLSEDGELSTDNEIVWFDPKGGVGVENFQFHHFLWRGSVGQWELVRDGKLELNPTKCYDCVCENGTLRRAASKTTPDPYAKTLDGFNLGFEYSIKIRTYQADSVRNFQQPRESSNSFIVVSYDEESDKWLGILEYQTNPLYPSYSEYSSCVLYDVEMIPFVVEHSEEHKELQVAVKLIPQAEYCDILGVEPVTFVSQGPFTSAFVNFPTSLFKIQNSTFFDEIACVELMPIIKHKVEITQLCCEPSKIFVTVEVPSILVVNVTASASGAALHGAWGAASPPQYPLYGFSVEDVVKHYPAANYLCPTPIAAFENWSVDISDIVQQCLSHNVVLKVSKPYVDGNGLYIASVSSISKTIYVPFEGPLNYPAVAEGSISVSGQLQFGVNCGYGPAAEGTENVSMYLASSLLEVGVSVTLRYPNESLKRASRSFSKILYPSPVTQTQNVPCDEDSEVTFEFPGFSGWSQSQSTPPYVLYQRNEPSWSPTVITPNPYKFQRMGSALVNPQAGAQETFTVQGYDRTGATVGVNALLCTSTRKAPTDYNEFAGQTTVIQITGTVS